MLTYVEKLTVTSSAVTEGDIDLLRSAGLSDRDILDIATVTAYFAYVNRLASGLGVTLETWL